jgi:hypothetical protein
MIRKYEPVPESNMLRVSPTNTICQVLRDIFCATDDECIRVGARLATAMAKSMDRKLNEYNKDWKNGFYDKNPEFRRGK